MNPEFHVWLESKERGHKLQIRRRSSDSESRFGEMFVTLWTQVKWLVKGGHRETSKYYKLQKTSLSHTNQTPFSTSATQVHIQIKLLPNFEMQFSKVVLAFAIALGVMSMPTGKKQNHYNKFIYHLNNITCSQHRGSRCPWAGTSLDWCQYRWCLQAWFRHLLSNRLLNERILLNGRAAIWSSKAFSIF